MTRTDLQDQRAQLIAYLLSKVKANDFHAVQDAASDIREIDAKLEVLTEQAHEADREAARPAVARRIG